jgi:hypothetical protein
MLVVKVIMFFKELTKKLGINVELNNDGSSFNVENLNDIYVQSVLLIIQLLKII